MVHINYNPHISADFTTVRNPKRKRSDSSDSPTVNNISKRPRRRVPSPKPINNSSQDDLTDAEFAEMQERAMKNRHNWKKQNEQGTNNDCHISQIA